MKDSESLRRSVNEWTTTIARVVGLASFVVAFGYEFAVDRFRNTSILIVTASVAGIPDILQLHKSGKEQRERERAAGE